ncbi:MAG: hypothetical protein CSA51_00495 [Gammaproteobacteria bacterium]|nr:MAG: hypothetical protein CSA51_00495 [Gammaproteobacteria bacterium]
MRYSDLKVCSYNNRLSILAFFLTGLMSFSAWADCSESSRSWVQKSYISYYGRPGDPGGIDYWACRMDGTGGNLKNIIDAFGVSSEFTERYGGLTNSELIDSIYRQMFNRDPDSAGKQWYLDELTSGRMNLQTITLSVLNGATGVDATIVANKLQLADYFTGVLAAGNVTYRDIELAKGLLEIVDDTAESVNRARGNADMLVNLWRNPGTDSAYCNNTCNYSRDGICDDGGDGSDNGVCNLGTDCADCGLRTANAACNEGCRYSGDGQCDDGGTNSDYAECALGSDCADCGDRSSEIPRPTPDPDPVPDPGSDNPHVITDPDMVIPPPVDAGPPETAVTIITDAKNNKAVAVNNILGEAFYVIFDGNKQVGSEAVLGAIYQTPDGQLIKFDFNASGQVTRMEVNGTVFSYTNHNGNTVDLTIDHADGRQETHRQVSLMAGGLHSQSQNTRLVASRVRAYADAGRVSAYSDGPSLASYAIGVVGTSVGIFLCGSQLYATGGLTASITMGCVSAAIGFGSVYLDNTPLGYGSAGLDLASGIATRDATSIATGLSGVISGLLGWQTEETELKAVVAGLILTTNGKGLIRKDNAETRVYVRSQDGNSSHVVTANKGFTIGRKFGSGRHIIRFEAKGYIIKEYKIVVSDGTVVVREEADVPGENDKTVKRITPSSVARPVVLYLVPELDPAPKITGHVVWPRKHKDQTEETERVQVEGGVVSLHDMTGAQTAWFTASKVDSENDVGRYEIYLPRKMGYFALKFKQNSLCFQDQIIPVGIIDSSEVASFSVPKASFREAETLNFNFNGDAEWNLDIPVISVYNGTFTGQGTPTMDSISYTYPVEFHDPKTGPYIVQVRAETECHSYDFHLELEDGAGEMVLDDTNFPVETGQCGEVYEHVARRYSIQGRLREGGTWANLLPPIADASVDQACSGTWAIPSLRP